MKNVPTEEKTVFCIKDVCLQIGVWTALVVGLLSLCILVPMMALSI